MDIDNLSIFKDEKKDMKDKASSKTKSKTLTKKKKVKSQSLSSPDETFILR